MININNIIKYCFEYTQIENYQLAVSDETQVWDCHHRKEIEENKNREQLIKEGLYYNRPPEEFIFLTKSEHIKLHNLNMSVEHKRKISEAIKEGRYGMTGKKHSKQTRIKMSLAKRGKKRKPISDETRRKISEACKLAWKKFRTN